VGALAETLGAESLPEPRFTSRDVMRAVRALGQMMRDVLTGSARGSRDRDLGAGASFRRIRNIQEALALMTPARHVVWVFVAIVLFWFSTQGLMINATTVLSSGMAPEILPGDLVAFAQTTYAVRAPARGDVVRYQPQGNGSRWVGRVVGLPGESVRIEAGRVFINGARLIEPNVREPAHDSMAETTIPADQYFILADSRGRSQGDSRRFGPISRPSISQKASMCYWPLRRFHLIRSPAYRFDQDGR